MRKQLSLGAKVCVGLIALWTVAFLCAVVPLALDDAGITPQGIDSGVWLRLIIYVVIYSIPALPLCIIALLLSRKP